MKDLSYIHPNAKISSSAYIGPFCYIGEEVEIGDNCKLLSHVIIKGPTKIGSGNIFYQFSTIGEDTPDKKFKGEKTYLLIGKDNIFREGVTIHRGTIQDQGVTTIENSNLFMAYTHVAHDCRVGSNNIMANNSGLAGHVNVGNYVTLGGYTLVHQFCRIGDFAFTGLNTVITMDIPAYVKIAANPARPIGLNTVGLQRHGFDESKINILKKAYRGLYRKGLSLSDAIKYLEELNQEHAGLLDVFLYSVKSSERGILR
ncbi:MAG: acyl-ACP--UDP-N-acetylglucosamine O-acyltransferase [Gammaproteobacteria bacterium]